MKITKYLAILFVVAIVLTIVSTAGVLVLLNVAAQTQPSPTPHGGEYLNSPTPTPPPNGHNKEYLVSPSPPSSLTQYVNTPSPSVTQANDMQGNSTGNEMINQQHSLSSSPTESSVITKDTLSSPFATTLVAAVSSLGVGVIIALAILLRRRV